MGGMGVLVLLTALLPSLGIRSHYLTQAETPGPVFSKLVPKQSQTSKILYQMYFALTLAEVILLRIYGLPLYDALIHAFSTAGTGGFSNRNLSVGATEIPPLKSSCHLCPALLSNFGLYFLLLQRRFKEALKSDEARFFLLLVAGSTALITIDIMPIYENVWDSLRYAFFQVASIISTTGFATAGLCAVAPLLPADSGNSYVLRRLRRLHRRRHQVLPGGHAAALHPPGAAPHRPSPLGGGGASGRKAGG